MNLRFLLSISLLVFLSATLWSQAEVQIIHNSPEPTVDIWVNEDPAITAFEFRDATEYIELPAGETISVGVAPSPSTEPSDIIASFDFVLEDGEKYIIIANGIVGDSLRPFNLEVYTPARSEAVDSGLVDIIAFHGSPDAPTVDIASGGQPVVPNLEYAEYSGYLSVPPVFLDLTVIPEGDDIGISYAADLRGLEGQSITVMASGFIDPDPSEPFFGLFAVLEDGSVLPLPQIAQAGVQIFHNSPGAVVDLYVNNELVIEEFDYGLATPYLEFPSNVPFEIGVAPHPSSGADDIIFTSEFVFESNTNYFVAATGIVGDPDVPFDLVANEDSRIVSDSAGQIDVNVFHGSPDAPPVDISSDPFGVEIAELSYGEFSPYSTIAPTFYTLDITPTGAAEPAFTFSAPLSQAADVGATVVASGFLDPGADEPGFQLLAVFPNGLVLPLAEFSTAELQVIHNSPSPDVDIYINGELALEEFAYRSATPYLEVPAVVQTNIAIAESPSNSVDDAFISFNVELTPDEAFILVAGGILGDDITPFSADLFASETEALEPEVFSFFVYHGSLDAPPVDALIRPDFVAAEDLEYTERTGYINAPPGNYILDLSVSATQDLINSYLLGLEGTEGQSAMVFASGLADPADGQPGFGLFAAFADGTVVEFDALEAPTVQVIHNSPSPTVDLWIGDEKILEEFEFRTATPYLELPSGDIEIGVALSPSDSPDDIIANFELTLLPGGNYVAVANGIVGNPETPFNLEVRENIILDVEQGFSNVLVFHGAPDVPDVNIGVLDLDDEEVAVIEDLSFGEFEGQLGIPALDWQLAIRLSQEPLQDVAVFSAPLSNFEGESLVVFASGFLGGDEPPFGLFAALEDGTVIMLDLITNVSQVHDLASLGIYPNPARDIVNIGLPEAQRPGTNEVLVHSLKGQLMRSFDVDNGVDEFQLDVSNYNEGYYLVTVISEEGVWTGRILVQR